MADFISHNQWMLDKLHDTLPSHLVSHIQSIKISPEENYRPIWLANPSGSFTSKSAWETFRKSRDLMYMGHQDVIVAPFATLKLLIIYSMRGMLLSKFGNTSKMCVVCLLVLLEASGINSSNGGSSNRKKYMK
uniref:Uncharacterized protein n=1 Tax=Nicotiana tabacum TaxID=4097 RepID=A0A1S3XCX1_TOBAC|nr:PREDICTED: uncharacterized protein LOC107763619 [Nicotiana tabacum]